MRKTLIAVVMLSGLFLLEGLSFAQEIALKAEVDKTKIGFGSALTYKLSVNSSQGNIPEPRFPDFRGFSILSETNTSKISIAQGKSKILLVYIFVLSPQETGVFTIKPAELKAGAKTYTSAEFKIEVRPSNTNPAFIPRSHPESLIPDRKNKKSTPEEESPGSQTQPQVTL